MNPSRSYEVEDFVRINRIISALPSTSNQVIDISSDSEDESEYIELTEESIKAFEKSKSDNVIEINSENEDESEFNEESIKSFKIYRHKALLDLQTDVDEYTKNDCTTISPNDENQPSTSGLNNKSKQHSMALKRNYFSVSPNHGPKKIVYTKELVAEIEDEELPFNYSFCDSLVSDTYSFVSQNEKIKPTFDNSESKDDANKRIKLNSYPHFSPISNPSTQSSTLVIDDSHDMLHAPVAHISCNIDAVVSNDQRRFSVADFFQEIQFNQPSTSTAREQTILPSHLAKETHYRNHSASGQNVDDSKKNITVEYACNAKVLSKASKMNAEFGSTCATVHKSEEEIFQHFLKKHFHVHLFYNQIEKSAENLLCTTLLTCYLHCNICGKQCNTFQTARMHYLKEHPYNCIDFKIFKHGKVMQSIDSKQPVNLVQNKLTQFHFRRLFHCSYHQTEICFSTISDAIAHYNQIHKTKEQFKLSLKSNVQKVENMLMDSSTFETKLSEKAIFLLECHHCYSIFETIEQFRQHRIEINREQKKFNAKRIFSCAYCRQIQIVGTYQALLNHHKINHLNKFFCLANPNNVQMCGYCNKLYTNINEFKAHFHNEHGKGDILTNDFFKSLNLNDVNFDYCKFSPGCCVNIIYDQLINMLQHTAENEHRLKCLKCVNKILFLNVIDFALHCTMYHRENKNEIIEKLHDINRFLALLSDMRIHFPGGLISTMNAIEDTKIGKNLKQTIVKHIYHNIWPKEFRILTV